MERGALDLGAYPGGLDLQATLESGQTYCWDRADGEMYDAARPAGGDAWYHTVVDGEVLMRDREVCTLPAGPVRREAERHAAAAVEHASDG